jgi:hypothetical protein
MANPFNIPSAGVSADNPLAPEYLALERQKRIAELLMNKSQQAPEGQMVSGHYVAPSLIQQLNPLFNAYSGAKMAGQNEAKTAELAQMLRGQGVAEINTFSNLMQKDPQAAYKYAATAVNPQLQKLGFDKMLPQDIKLGAEETFTRLNPNGTTEVLAKGQGKAHVVGNSLIVDGKEIFKGEEKPVQIDTGTEIRFIEPKSGKVIYSTPKHHVFAPHAPQIVETANGPMLVNPYTGNATPIMANGQTLAPKLNPEQTKDIVGINQQRSTILGAIDAVKANPKAFTFGRGLAQNLPAGETIAGRYESPAATQARAYVFNNVSAVIKERAGTAQSASEMQRINSFMPSTKDNDKQIIAKLDGFNQYLNDLEKGTRIPTTQINTSNPVKTQPNTPITIKSDDDYNALPSGAEFIDPKGVKRRKP